LEASSRKTLHTREHRVYGARTCGDCPLRAKCTKATQGRRIKRYPEDEQRDALRLVMQHPQARRIFSQRKAIVEPVFGSLRGQQGLNRFRRRGLAAVRREFALHVMAHNLSRAAALLRAVIGLLCAALLVLRWFSGQLYARDWPLGFRASVAFTPAVFWYALRQPLNDGASRALW
jgi:hypothetical protein